MRTFWKTWLGIGLVSLGVGIALLLYLLGTGAKWSDIPTYSMDESYKDVESLDIKIAYGELIIKNGDTFRIEARNLVEDGYETYVSDGNWIIREDTEDYFDFFGLDIPIHNLSRHWDGDMTPNVTITIPDDFIAENISIRVGAGTVEADTIRAEKGYFKVDAGKMEIDQLQISGDSDYQVGAGEMILQRLVVNDITVDCGVGKIVMEGSITGDNTVSCGIGEVDMKIDGDQDEFSYKIDSGIGSIRINNKSYHSIGNRVIKNEDAKYSFDLDCGIGNITVEIN